MDSDSEYSVPATRVGPLLVEGKTKQVHALTDDAQHVFVLSKDRITAGDGLKAHALQGKAAASTRTAAAVFQFLNACHVPTHFVARVRDEPRAFVAKKCLMVPIEWVARRVATGSFLKRHAHVREGTRFAPPKLETFFKDDANHDPFWSEETLVAARLQLGHVTIEERHVRRMLALTRLVFELLERAWASVSHVLVDLKIEFGLCEATEELLVADVIDNDSWRLWPDGDKNKMLDKQLYRDLAPQNVDARALDQLQATFELVAARAERLFAGLATSAPEQRVLVLVGSVSDLEHARAIERALHELGVAHVDVRVASAHKTTAHALRVMSEAESCSGLSAVIAVAGLSNGLGPVAAGNLSVPVINCPPISGPEALQLDVWSSLRMPSGLGVTTALGASNAALGAALIVGGASPLVWGRIRTNQALQEIKTLFIDAQ